MHTDKAVFADLRKGFDTLIIHRYCKQKNVVSTVLRSEFETEQNSDVQTHCPCQSIWHAEKQWNVKSGGGDTPVRSYKYMYATIKFNLDVRERGRMALEFTYPGSNVNLNTQTKMDLVQFMAKI